MNHNIWIINDQPIVLDVQISLVKQKFPECIAIEPERNDERYMSVLNAIKKISVHPKSMPDLILMDMEIFNDEEGGINISRKLLNSFPSLRILFVSGFCRLDSFQKAIAIPEVRGFIRYDSTRKNEELLNAITYILESDRHYFSPDVLEMLVSHYRSLLITKKM